MRSNRQDIEYLASGHNSFFPSAIKALLCLSVLTCTFTSGLLAAEPGRGLTGPFEVNFMELTIDHHFTALRMTELAAGTDPQRQAAISPDEGTSPTPGFASTSAKASLDDLKSLARRNNRMQREEILTFQTFLRDWYGINYQPKVRPENLPLINVLEKAQAGDDFNHAFFEAFSRHHFMLFSATKRLFDRIGFASLRSSSRLQ